MCVGELIVFVAHIVYTLTHFCRILFDGQITISEKRIDTAFCLLESGICFDGLLADIDYSRAKIFKPIDSRTNRTSRKIRQHIFKDGIPAARFLCFSTAFSRLITKCISRLARLIHIRG